LILGGWLLLVAGGVAPRLMELLAGLVLLGSYMRGWPSAWATTACLVQRWKGALKPILLGKRFKGAVGRGSSSVEEFCIELCIVPEARRTLSPVRLLLLVLSPSTWRSPTCRSPSPLPPVLTGRRVPHQGQKPPSSVCRSFPSDLLRVPSDPKGFNRREIFLDVLEEPAVVVTVACYFVELVVN